MTAGAGEKILGFLRGKKREIVEKKEIMGILPHRGRMLLLDQVEISNKSVIGRLMITAEHCLGHAVAGEKEIFRGVDVLEMAAQLLGVFVGIRHPEFREKAGLLRSFGGAKFSDLIFVGDFLEIEVDPVRITEKALTEKSTGRRFIIITGREILAKVGKKRKAEIKEIKLALIDIAQA